MAIYVETLKTDVIVFIINVMMCLTLTNIFQYQSQFVDTENIYEIRGQMSKRLYKVCIKLVIQNSSKTNLIYRMVGFFM